MSNQTTYTMPSSEKSWLFYKDRHWSIIIYDVGFGSSVHYLYLNHFCYNNFEELDDATIVRTSDMNRTFDSTKIAQIIVSTRQNSELANEVERGEFHPHIFHCKKCAKRISIDTNMLYFLEYVGRDYYVLEYNRELVEKVL